MRFALILACLPLPSAAWQFSPEPICTLSHQTDTADISITYDARLPEYTLQMVLTEGEWPDAYAFSISFEGGRQVLITTPNHQISADRSTLTVRDRGFGNVLNGLEFNNRMIAQTGERREAASLTDAALAVQAFRTCPTDLPPVS